MEEPKEHSRILTLVFTDLVSSTALKHEHGDQAAGRLVTRHREHVQQLAIDTGGRIVDWAGDGCFLTFETPSAAVRFALGLQLAHGNHPDLPRVRIGIHIGEVSEQASPSAIGRPDVEGLAVDLASRIADLAEAGQILLSASAFESSRSRVETEIEGHAVRWESHGSYRLKGFDKPVEVCEVGFGDQAPFRRPVASGKAVPVSDELADAAGDRAATRRRNALLATLATVAVAAAVYFATQQEPTAAPTNGASSPITSLAVLPFDNYSGEAEQDYFVEGMTEALISELAQIRGLRVISRTSVMQYRGTDKPAPEVARELGVDGLIEGSVYKGGEEVRITAQLIRGDTDEHLWAASYTESLENVLQLQARIALAISREIRLNLTPDDEKRLASARKTDPEAHAALLKARHFHNRITPKDFEIAGRYYREALQHDPDYAPAYAGLANLSWAPSVVGASQATIDVPTARALANEAVRLDPDNADGHVALAWMTILSEWNWARAEKEFRRAIDLDPSRPGGYQGLADLLVHRRRNDEALATARAALESDPLSPVCLWELGYVQTLGGQFDAAIQTFDRLGELAPDFNPPGDVQVAYVLAGRIPDALRIARETFEQHPTRTNAAVLAFVLASAGRDEEARTVLERDVVGKDEYVMPATPAWAYAALGDKDEAFRWMRQAMDARDYAAFTLYAHPNFVPLRSDPRFSQMVEEMGLAD